MTSHIDDKTSVSFKTVTNVLHPGNEYRQQESGLPLRDMFFIRHLSWPDFRPSAEGI